jgi:hypothetical protein
MLAYLQIDDPALRKQVIRLAERLAGHPQPTLIPDFAQDNVRSRDADPADVASDNIPKLDPLP